MDSVYTVDLEPLFDCINIIYQLELLPIIRIEIQKYGAGFLVTDTSKQEFTVEVKKAVTRVLSLVSKDYLIKMKKYFSDEGLTLFIFSNLLKQTLLHIKEQ